LLYQINQLKWNLVRSKQEQTVSYEEACRDVIQRCKFLLQEIQPFDAPEILAYEKEIFLSCTTRWETAIRKVKKDVRFAKLATQRSSRPEDIVNSSIQNMDSYSSQASGSTDQLINKRNLSSKILVKGQDTENSTKNVNNSKVDAISTGENLPEASGDRVVPEYKDVHSTDSVTEDPLARPDAKSRPVSPMLINSGSDLNMEDSLPECTLDNPSELLGTDRVHKITVPNSIPKAVDQPRNNEPQKSIVKRLNLLSPHKKSKNSRKTPKRPRPKKDFAPEYNKDFRDRFANIIAFVTSTATLGLEKVADINDVRKSLLIQVRPYTYISDLYIT